MGRPRGYIVSIPGSWIEEKSEENIRDLNFVVVKLSTVQVTKLLL
jgi:hypothetical protein